MDSATSLKIFLVDDDSFSLEVTNQYLRQSGYTDITIFRSGSACLDQLTERPQLIFLDHNMDDLDGFEVLKKIKRFDPNIFVIMLSGQEKIITAVNALKYGAFDYIIKGADSFDHITKALTRINLAMIKIQNSKPSIWKKISSFI